MVACVQTTPLPQKNYDNRYLTQKDWPNQGCALRKIEGILVFYDLYETN